MTIKVILEAYEDGCFAAYAPELPGCLSEGETEKEALDNLKIAVELCLDSGDEASLDVEKRFIKDSAL